MKRFLPLLMALFAVLPLCAQDVAADSSLVANDSTIAVSDSSRVWTEPSALVPDSTLVSEEPFAAVPDSLYGRAEFPRVSLLTCSPGVEIYEQYGHTAIRLEDPAKGWDVVFNYGLFSFEAPHFVWRFCRGLTDYIVGEEDYTFFEREYLERGSAITTQVLDLDSSEVVRFCQLMGKNLQPQNRTYRYNFLYKNCSTMARDILYRSFTKPVEATSVADTVTFRDMLHQHNAGYPWASFGIDLVLGVEVDRPIARDKQEFAPACLMQTFANATRSGRPLVCKTTTIGPVHPYPDTFAFPLTPVEAMIVVLLITAIICTLELLRRRRIYLFDILLYGVQGIAGLVITFLFLFSGHPGVDSNVLVALFNPLAFVLLPCLISQSRHHRKPWALWTELGLIALLAVLALCLRQEVPVAAWVFMAALLLRTLHHLLIWTYGDKIMKGKQSTKR